MTSPAMRRRLPVVPGHARFRCRAMAGLGAFDLDQRVAVGHATAPVGERVVGEAVGDLAVRMLMAPTTPWDSHQPRPQPAADLHRQLEAGAIVEDPGAVALCEPT